MPRHKLLSNYFPPTNVQYMRWWKINILLSVSIKYTEEQGRARNQNDLEKQQQKITGNIVVTNLLMNVVFPKYIIISNKIEEMK